MRTSYFLGANSAAGFSSLYDGFCRGEGDYLTIIKGGPGTGKSGFMRKLAAAAEARGYDTEVVLCSGDPASLDGLYIPQLNRGWVDGTAPHSIEPRRFGVDSDYVNLGAFCHTPLKSEDADRARRLFESYRTHYGRAYDCLASAAKLGNISDSEEYTAEDREKTARWLRKLIFPETVKEELFRRIRPHECGKKRFRFLHGLCCEGELILREEFDKQCGRVYCLDGAVNSALHFIADLVCKRGTDVIVCPSPLRPERYEAVMIPDYSVGFVSAEFAERGAGSCSFGSSAAAPDENADKLRNIMLTKALTELKDAKSDHDALESLFIAAMDYNSLDAFTEKYIREVF